MIQIRVSPFVAIFLTIIILSAGQPLINLPNCSRVCGLKVVSNSNFVPEIQRPTYSAFNNTNVCAENSILPITAWNRSAQDFMKYLGMNDEEFGCLMENSVTTIPHQLGWQMLDALLLKLQYGKRNHGLIGPTLPKNLDFLGSKGWMEELDNNSGSCTVDNYPAIKRRLPNNRFTTNWLPSVTLYDKKTMETEGIIFSALDQMSGSLLNIRVPKNSNDTCIMNNCTSFLRFWLPVSTFNTSVSVAPPKNKSESIRSSAPSHSMFARINFDELPGAKKVLEELEKGVEDYENVNNDLSPSNLAILCLPLLMAIPPLSLLGPASDATVAWYAFATDILAAVPLMIKGIEMVLFYRKAVTRMDSTLGLVGEKFQIFETWYIQCHPPKGRVSQDGVTIVAVALWFMMASTYAEFLFWREMRYREGRLRKFEDSTGRLPNIEPMNSTAGETDCRLKRILRSCSRGRRKYSVSLSVILMVEFFLLFTGQFPGDLFDLRHIFDVVPILTAITLVVFRAVLVKRFRQFIQWRFWIGVVFGFLTGPVYLLMHAFKHVRKSYEWELIAEGCNVGIGFLALTVGMLLKRVIKSANFASLALLLVGFPWMYGASVILTHAIRSEASDRKVWRYGCHGFALGMLFGPFGCCSKDASRSVSCINR